MNRPPGSSPDIQLPDWEFVELLRIYFEVYDSLTRLFAHFREGRPCFDEVAELVGGDDTCILFRLKERCHALFRTDDASGLAMRREALFDLAVGSLFHESMKLRESLYQQEVYAPQVAKLLAAEAGEVVDFTSDEFDRLERIGDERTREAMLEAENLLARTQKSLKHLLAASAGNGLMMRFVVAHPEQVMAVFGMDVSDLLEEISGDPVQGYRAAFHSHLSSAFYHEAIECLKSAPEHVRSAPDLEDMLYFARGMSRFQAGRYADSLEALDGWKRGPGASSERAYAALAHEALSHINHLVEEDEREVLTRKARKLGKRFQAWAEPAGKGAARA